MGALIGRRRPGLPAMRSSPPASALPAGGHAARAVEPRCSRALSIGPDGEQLFVFCLGVKVATMIGCDFRHGREIRQLVLPRLQLVIEKLSVPKGLALQWQRDQISESAVRKHVLTRKQPVGGSDVGGGPVGHSRKGRTSRPPWVALSEISSASRPGAVRMCPGVCASQVGSADRRARQRDA